MGLPRPLQLRIDRGFSIPHGVFERVLPQSFCKKVRLKTRSSDRYKIAHLIPRNPNVKMESYWEWLPPELQKNILQLKAWAEHRDTMKALVKEIGEFCPQPLPEDDHQGDSCCFFLFFFFSS